jgi:3-oxoacyl-[acyl-carrier protein] reductase
MARAVVPGMKKAGGGRIVTISSGAGIKASRTGIQAYCAAKHALVGLTRQLSKELGQFGITVNSVAPGFVLSNPTTILQYDSYGEAGKAAMLQGISMRRLGTVEDITYGVLFLASPFASYVTGQVLCVDGGT